MSDLADRRYLEQYLPANLEFDQFQMNMKVKVINSSKTYALKVNGKKRELGNNTFEVTLPSFYSSSSLFFHLFPEDQIGNTQEFDYLSIDGRKIPIDIYTGYNAEEFATAAVKILAELENDYGPFPHDQLIIYGNMSSGGMEYSGATATSLKALGHEIFHSYHARGLMPANGNAGWMDEAIARWRDNKYPLVEKLTHQRGSLGGRPAWARSTDGLAYTDGSNFLSWIAYRMNQNGQSFKQFLRDYFTKYKHTTVTTELFRDEIKLMSGLPLDKDFDRYIFGKGSLVGHKLQRSVAPLIDDPNHPRLSLEEQRQLLWPSEVRP
jgi:hypothetical protein